MASPNPSKIGSIAHWALKGLVALAFLTFATFKLSGQPMMVQEFGVLGLGQGFRYVTGLTEVAGAILLLVPMTSRFGALVLLCVSVGACIAQATRLHGDVIHTIVLIAITGLLSWMAWRSRLADPAVEVA